jgi:hypothetical protein
MKSLFIVSSGIAGLLLMGPLVKESAAIVLTGTWEGTALCGGVVQGTGKNLFNVPITLKVSQDATNVNADITIDPFDPQVHDLNGGPGSSLGGHLDGTHRYEGETKGSSNNKVKALIDECGTTFSGKPHKGSFKGVDGFIKATSKKGNPPLLSGTLNELDEDDNTAVTCVFDGVVLTDPTDPNVPDCP